MKNAITTINGWISVFTGLFAQLIILGVVVGLLFDDQFGVIEGIGKTMSLIGQNGLASLIALVFITNSLSLFSFQANAEQYQH